MLLMLLYRAAATAHITQLLAAAAVRFAIRHIQAADHMLCYKLAAGSVHRLQGRLSKAS